MTDHAAISAVYVDYRRVKTRKVHQIILEVPSEQWPEAYKALGEPDIDNSAWFALAKLLGVPGEKLKGGAVAQQAGIVCGEGAFKQWVATVSNESPDQYIRIRCNVESRAHLDHDPEAAKLFRDMRSEYEFWMRSDAA